MDIASYSSDSRAIIKIAREVAAEFRHPEIEAEHLLIATVRNEDTDVESVLSELKKTPGGIASLTETYLKEQSSRIKPRDNLTASPATQSILNQAIDERNKLYDALVEPIHILIAIFDPRSSLSGYLKEKIGIAKEDIYRAIAEKKAVEEIASTDMPAKTSGDGHAVDKPSGKVSGTLKYCVDMTNLAASGEFDPMIGREQEVQEVVQILLRRRKNSPVLVGGAGVGKSAIIEGFAQAVVEGRVPKKLQDVKVMEVDMGSMVAGAKYKGEFEERFKSLISEVIKSGGKIVLFIDEIHSISGTGSGGAGMDAANLLKPPLARGQIRLIGATTEDEYTKYLEKDKALDRRFQKVKVEEPSVEDAIRIVKGVLPRYIEHYDLEYKSEAVTGAVKYAKRYLSEYNLPDIALDLIDEAGSEFSVKEENAKTLIPAIEEKIPELEKMIREFEGKKPEEDVQKFEELSRIFEEFDRQVKRLDDFWGHRAEMTGGDQ